MAKAFNRPPAAAGTSRNDAATPAAPAANGRSAGTTGIGKRQATAGGGAVKVTMSGDQKCQAVEIARIC